VFGLNSLYDPDVTFTGHQPLLFDQMAALYSNYCVYDAKVMVSVIPLGNETSPSLAVFYKSNTNTAASYTLDEAREQKGAVERYIGGDRKVVTLTSAANIRDLIGKSKDYVLDDPAYAGGVTGNPTDVAYGIFEVGTLDGTSRTFYCEVCIDFDVAFSQVKQQSSS